MTHPPLIGITAGNDPDNPSYYILRWDYVRSVEAAGGLPVVLAPGGATKQPGLLDRLNGIILSGGCDINPSFYGMGFHPTLSRTSIERDAFEIELVREAITRDMPVLGICRGSQIINVASGGTLIQDIPSLFGRGVIHNDPAKPRHTLMHPVTIEPESKLASLLRATELPVNSFHHQSIDRPGGGLVVTSRSPEGVVEGIERPDSTFVVGVQWHPEAFWANGEYFAPLFEALVMHASS